VPSDPITQRRAFLQVCVGEHPHRAGQLGGGGGPPPGAEGRRRRCAPKATSPHQVAIARIHPSAQGFTTIGPGGAQSLTSKTAPAGDQLEVVVLLKGHDQALCLARASIIVGRDLSLEGKTEGCHPVARSMHSIMGISFGEWPT